jgi:hypothetical protein
VKKLAGLLVTVAFASDAPKPKVTDYPVHAELPAISIGAEFLVRSILSAGQSFTSQDYLVADVALYPGKEKQVEVSLKDFFLRVNGKKLLATPPQFVAAAFRHPEDSRRPRLEAEAGAGDAGVILGRPRASERFPGDPTPRQGRLPDPPRTTRTDAPAPAPVRGEDVAVNDSLPEGECKFAKRGFVYFPYKGKTTSIKTVELVYQGPAGSASLKLR